MGLDYSLVFGFVLGIFVLLMYLDSTILTTSFAVVFGLILFYVKRSQRKHLEKAMELEREFRELDFKNRHRRQ